MENVNLPSTYLTIIEGIDPWCMQSWIRTSLYFECISFLGIYLTLCGAASPHLFIVEARARCTHIDIKVLPPPNYLEIFSLSSKRGENQKGKEGLEVLAWSGVGQNFCLNFACSVCHVTSKKEKQRESVSCVQKHEPLLFAYSTSVPSPICIAWRGW